MPPPEVPSPVPAGTEPEQWEHRLVSWTYDRPRCRCGWVGDDFWVHAKQVIDALLAGGAAVVSSSPATPARHPGDEGNPAIDALKASSARIATAPPASPAETREGRERLAEAVATHLEATAEPWSYADGVARDATIRAALRAGDFIREWVDPACPAVSLPGEAEKGARLYFDVLRSMTNDPRILAAVDEAESAPSLPGEQPGGQDAMRRWATAWADNLDIDECYDSEDQARETARDLAENGDLIVVFRDSDRDPWTPAPALPVGRADEEGEKP